MGIQGERRHVYVSAIDVHSGFTSTTYYMHVTHYTHTHTRMHDAMPIDRAYSHGDALANVNEIPDSVKNRFISILQKSLLFSLYHN